MCAHRWRYCLCVLILSVAACSKTEPMPYDGLALFAPLHSNEVQLRNNLHQVVHRWECELPPGQCTKLMDDGSLLRTARLINPAFEKVYGKGSGGRVDWLEWDGKNRWQFTLSDDQRLLHHDIEVMNNGNLLMLVWVKIPLDDSLARGCTTASAAAPLISEQIIEVNPTSNEIVWQWNAWDHLVQNMDTSLPDYGQPEESPTRIDVNLVRDENDWLHFNSVSYSAEHDLIAVSCRQSSEIWLLDHSTSTEQASSAVGGRRGVGGDIWRRWGASTSKRELYHQHAVNWIGKGLHGAGNLMVFDNGDDQQRPFSRVLELCFHQNETGPRTFEIVWEFSGGAPIPMYSAFVSNAQRLPNGNTLVCSGTQGWVLEIDRSGQVCWQYRFEVQDRYDWLFRVEKYPWDIASKFGVAHLTKNQSKMAQTLAKKGDLELRQSSMDPQPKTY